MSDYNSPLSGDDKIWQQDIQPWSNRQYNNVMANTPALGYTFDHTSSGPNATFYHGQHATMTQSSVMPGHGAPDVNTSDLYEFSQIDPSLAFEPTGFSSAANFTVAVGHLSAALPETGNNIDNQRSAQLRQFHNFPHQNLSSLHGHGSAAANMNSPNQHGMPVSPQAMSRARPYQPADTKSSLAHNAPHTPQKTMHNPYQNANTFPGARRTYNYRTIAYPVHHPRPVATHDNDSTQDAAAPIQDTIIEDRYRDFDWANAFAGRQQAEEHFRNARDPFKLTDDAAKSRYPQTDAEKKPYIIRICKAMTDVSNVEGLNLNASEDQLKELNRQPWYPWHKQDIEPEDIAARAHQIVDFACLIYEQGGSPMYALPNGKSRKQMWHGKIGFDKRIEQICHTLSTNKVVCCSIMDGDKIPLLVSGADKYDSRSQGNKRGNTKKAQQIKAGKEVMGTAEEHSGRKRGRSTTAETPAPAAQGDDDDIDAVGEVDDAPLKEELRATATPGSFGQRPSNTYDVPRPALVADDLNPAATGSGVPSPAGVFSTNPTLADRTRERGNLNIRRTNSDAASAQKTSPSMTSTYAPDHDGRPAKRLRN